MTLRGARACVVLEVRRGQRGMLVGVFLAALVAVANIVGPTGAGSPGAILLLVLPGVVGFFAGIAPYGTLIADRHEGRLSVERALPQPWIVTAGARLIGAAIRALVTPAFTIAIFAGIARQAGPSITWRTAATVAIAAWMLVSMLCWILMAANVRWSMLRLWWVPTSLWVVPQVVPDTWWANAAVTFRPLAAMLSEAVTNPRGAWLLVAGLLAATTMTWVGTTALYASGLRRFVHDPDPLGLRRKSDRARPALEYPAGRRGVTAAVALHDVRLGMEQLAKQWVILAILVVVAIAGPDTLRELAPLYIRIIGYMVPGVVVIGLLAARRSGALAALQFLPHPRWKVAAGKLAAVSALSLLAATLGTIGRMLGDDAFTLSPRAFGNSALLIAANVWIAVTMTAWWRIRHLLWLVPLAAGLGGAALLAGDATAALVQLAYRVVQHQLAPSLWFAMVAAAGIPLFSWGLATYERR